jgi:hypothetical protein
MLMDIVIVDLTRIDMVQRALMMTTHAMMMVVQENAQSFFKRALSDDFIPLLLRCMGVFILILIHF